MDNVFIIAATNRPDIVDPALLRPGRFDKLLLIPIPDEKSRLKILEVHTRDMPLQDVDLKEIVGRLEGYVGADIQNLCREAALIALRESKKASNVTAEHFEKAILKIKPSTDPETVKYYESQTQELRTAMSKKSKDDYSLGYYR
jgi:transitional endoplasmic reticulum ATPase